MSTPPPFPTPEELSAQQRAELEPQLQLLRQQVRDAFAKGSSSGNEYWIDKPEGIRLEAYTEVGKELAVSGWTTRHESSRNEDSWVIWPKS